MPQHPIYCHFSKEVPMASALIKNVTDATFEAEVLQSAQPVLVDYWAEWCGPCKMIAPILDDVSAVYEGKLQIAKMNVDENRDIPGKFGIRGIPTLMLFKNGELAATKVGAMSKAQLVAFIDQQLA
jgi:thioredoxin 1